MAADEDVHEGVERQDDALEGSQVQVVGVAPYHPRTNLRPMMRL